MKRTTIFTWGYYGWGNHTPQLVEAVDAVETSRGFKPPIFVDIRIRRTVRAQGFLGSAFEKRLGPTRYRWMKSLGNKFILTHTGPNIQIADPSAADELLELAIDSSARKQRLLFFCSCQWPRWECEICCHRTTVAGLVLKAAKKRGAAVEIVEWPGGKPRQIDLEVTAKVFTAVGTGRWTVPMDKHTDLAEVAGLPWCSIATLHSDGEKLHRLVGRAIRQPGQWVLPVLFQFDDPSATLANYQKETEKLRRNLGLGAASSSKMKWAQLASLYNASEYL
jgi:hypothetical protein